MLRNYCIECKSAEEEMKVLEVLEQKGNKWVSRVNATKSRHFCVSNGYYALVVCNDGEICFCVNKNRYINGYTDSIVKNCKVVTAKEFLEEHAKKECIVIYRKGSETVALDKTTGKKAVAKCSPEDTYDFYTGAQLAFERLTGKATTLKPYLQHETGTNYGYLGSKTNIKDVIGRELKVGDVVELYDNENGKRDDSLIVEKDSDIFVMGIACNCQKDGTITEFKIIKKRGYEDVANGKKIRGVKYFK